MAFSSEGERSLMLEVCGSVLIVIMSGFVSDEIFHGRPAVRFRWRSAQRELDYIGLGLGLGLAENPSYKPHNRF